MAQQKYIYQPDLLRYIPEKKSWKAQLIRNSPFFLIAFILGILTFVITSALSLTPEEIRLKSVNHELEIQYHELNLKLSQLNQQIVQLESTDDNVYRALLGESPIDTTIRKAGIGGAALRPTNRQYPEIVRSTRATIEQFQSRLAIEEKSLVKLLKIAGNNNDRMLHLPAIMPIENKDLRRTGAGFGMRFHPILGIYRIHEGIDFIVPSGTEIYSTAGGIIKDVRLSKTFGKIVEIDHQYGYTTLYAHLSKYNVAVGQKVNRGEVIAWSGSTGLSSGPHLHYEVHLKGTEIDPVNYFFNDLSAKQYEEIKRLAIEHETSLD